MPDRFSLRHGFEARPDKPIFDDAPKRLRFFVLKSLKQHFETSQARTLVGEVLCITELIARGATPPATWITLERILTECQWFEIYNLIERIYSDLTARQSVDRTTFANDVNQLFGEESIGWKLIDGKLDRTLPAIAQTQVESVFRELQNPRFAPALAHITAAHKAYNARPRRNYDVCSNAFDGCESVAKEVFKLPTGTFGDVLKQARGASAFSTETIGILEKLYALASNHFRHGMTQPFALGPSEVEFVYLTCIAVVLLFIRLP